LRVPSARSAKRNIGLPQLVVSALGPGSRARADTVRKFGAEARAWPGHERVAGETRLFARSAGNRARCRIIPIHNVKQRSRSLLRSRGALLRPGFAFLFSIHPHEGRAERRKAQYSVVARFGARRDRA
jgi:hypothetical protein